MAEIHLLRSHHLGLAKARKIAFKWAEQAEAEFAMECSYAEGHDSDEVRFSRAGVNGTLAVHANQFELHVQLGFLAGSFKHKIETEIVNKLDSLLTTKAKKTKKN